METESPVQPEALREILTRAVRRTCPAWLADHREDLVQTAWVRILRKINESKEQQPLAASYIWKVAHSVVMDEMRHRRRHPEVELENPGVMEPVARQESPEGSHAASELREAIHDAIRTLSEPRRWAVLLYLYGFSLEDSARMLGWNRKRVDNQRYLGLAELRAHLSERGYEP